MIANAAEAVLAYRGLNFDRDGDPANGDEFTVNWLMEEDTPVAASAGYILAQMVADGVELLIETNLDPQDGLTVIRRPETDLAERFWTGSELVPAGSSGHNHLFRLLDTEKGGWPRVYDLVFEDSGRIQALDQVDLDLPRMAAIELSASPNPFNPRVNIHFVLPQAGKALLQIFDLRGHLVRTLLDEYRPMGSDTVFWLGDDESGRALASGVYQMRLATEEQLIEQRITLLR
ncbi:MAG: hypothetical protein KOO60_14640, partial [Gemmatimonadales bacterium]|nr:hypothetical protein [Gemmatimonadales bacterium]